MESFIHKQLNQTRYNLHKKIRKEGYNLVTKKRTIYVFYLNTTLSPAVLRLRKEFGYAVQTELASKIKK